LLGWQAQGKLSSLVSRERFGPPERFAFYGVEALGGFLLEENIMSCSEHNTTDCLICTQVGSICRHGNMGVCSECGPTVVFGKVANVAARANGCGCYMCAPQAGPLRIEAAVSDTLELARTRIVGLEEAVRAITRRAGMLTDELGAMRSDRDDARREVTAMRKAFEIQSRQLAKVSKPTLPRR
jgi:hypothetical protein